MTVKLSISVPDEVAAFLATHDNASRIVAVAVQRYMNDASVKQQARREAADAYVAWINSGDAPPEFADPEVIDELNTGGLPASYRWS